MLEALIILLLFSSATGLVRYMRDLAHPYFWTNLSFLFYGISLIYLYTNGIDGARFLILAGVDVDLQASLTLAALVILIGKLSLEAMDRFVRRADFVPHKSYRISSMQMLLLRTIAIIFSLIGLIYWLYVMAVLTNGSFRIFSNIGVFKHVIKDSGLSTIWFHLLYIGAQLWFLSFFLARRAQGYAKYLFFVPAFVVMLTTGRLAQSFLLLLVPIIFTLFNGYGRVSFARIWPLAIASVGAIVFLFFFRQFTSYDYIGRADDFFALIYSETTRDYILESLVGGGNLPDPQQLVLIFDGIASNRLQWTYGVTYFDWLINFVSDDGVQSVGYRILNEYFPEKVGGPTPGATGEALLNFGPFFPFFFLLVSYLFSQFHRVALRSSSILVRFVYIKTLLHFWALYIKVDSSLLLGLMWQVVPITIVWLLLVQRRRGRRVLRTPA